MHTQARVITTWSDGYVNLLVVSFHNVQAYFAHFIVIGRYSMLICYRLKVCGNCTKQVYWHHFSNSISSLLVSASHSVNHHISNFFLFIAPWLRVSVSRWWLLLLRSTGSRCVGSGVVVRRLHCPAACGVFPDRGLDSAPALAGGFLTTAPPGRSQTFSSLLFLLWWSFMLLLWLTEGLDDSIFSSKGFLFLCCLQDHSFLIRDQTWALGSKNTES